MREFLVRQAPEYRYRLGAGCLEAAADLFRFHGLDDIVIVTNEALRPLYGEALKNRLQGSGLACALLCVPEGERYKTLASAESLYDRLLDLDARRATCIAALGGGVIGDLAGFVAATYMRGLPLVQLPTSLLAMVDSSIGGKTAVDLPRGKNLVGAFHTPCFVAADTSVLSTLPPRELSCGMAEVIKAALVASEDLFAALESEVGLLDLRSYDALEEVIEMAARIKAEIVESDPFEKGRRAQLNLGHTLGHALEASASYKGLSHGEAVALGMLFALKVSRALGVLSEDYEERLVKILTAMELPVVMPPVPWETIVQPMLHDKKRSGGPLRMVLPVRCGEVTVREVPIDTARSVYSTMSEGDR
jgi:3-dehydroquinate synthase